MDKDQVLDEAQSFYFPGNETGILLIHGFTGSTQSMRGYGEYLANKGYTVLGPRLSGHGTTPEQMEMVSYLAWIKDVESALEKMKEMCEKVYVAGLSMGGTLSLYLAEKHPDLAGVILINPAVKLSSMKEYYEEKKDKPERFIQGLGSDIKKPNVEELAYKLTPVKSMGDLIELMGLVRRNLVKVTAPTLIFSSVVDHVVPPENSIRILNEISSENKELISLENSYHVATLDNDLELINTETDKFIRAH